MRKSSKHTPRCVLAFGASGFLGRYMVANWLARGWQVRLVTRDPVTARGLAVAASPGQLQVYKLDLCDVARLAAALPLMMPGVDAVYYGAAMFTPKGRRDAYGLVHVDAAVEVAKSAVAHGVSHFVLMSGLGLEDMATPFSSSRVRAEKQVAKVFPNVSIMRPSLIYGRNDSYLLKFAAMARFVPFFMVPGADCVWQPVYAGDVAEASSRLLFDHSGRVVEIAGPEVMSNAQALMRACQLVGYKRRVFNLPRWMLWPFALLLELVFSKPWVTREQLKMLKGDHSLRKKRKAFTLEDLGITPTAMHVVIPRELRHIVPRKIAISSSVTG